MNDIPLSVKPVNRHIVDRLADVREEIKSLKEQENTLKDIISKEMGSAHSLGGDEFIAHQSVSKKAGNIDAEALKKAGINVDQFRKPHSIICTLRLERRALEEV